MRVRWRWACFVLLVLGALAAQKYRYTRLVKWLNHTPSAQNFVPDPAGSLGFRLDYPAKVMNRLDPGSRFELNEDEKPLPYPDSSRAAVAREGCGRYLAMREQLYFSTSDNSDPRSNGRAYVLYYTGVSDRGLAAVWLGVSAACGVLLAFCMAGWWRAARSEAASAEIQGWAPRNVFVWLKTQDSLLTWLAVPPLLFALLSSQDMFFCGPGYLDPFMYVAYFRHYHEHLPLFDAAYKISRLPWVLPGFVCHLLAGPIIGSYLLHVGTMWLGNMLLYLAVKATFGDRRAALVTALFYACCTSTHGVGGWNYHCPATLACYFGSLWALARVPGSPHGDRWSLLAGAFVAAAIHSHLTLAAFLPMQALHFAVLLRVREGQGQSTLQQAAALRPGMLHRLALLAQSPFWRGTLRVVYGGLLLTAVLGALNLVTGGDFLFFMPQVKYVIALSAGNVWFVPGAAWLVEACWLVVPGLLLLGAFLVLGLVVLSRRPREEKLLLGCTAANYLVALGLLAYLQFGKNQTLLQSDFQSILLLAPGMPVLGAVLYGFARQDEHHRWHASAIALVVLFCAPLLLIPESQRLAALEYLGLFPILPPLVLGTLALAGWVLAGRAQVVFWIGLLPLSAANFLTCSVAQHNVINPRAINRDMLTTFVEADRVCEPFSPTLREVKFWFSPTEEAATDQGALNLSAVFNSYVATRGWLGNLLACRSTSALEELTEKDVRGVRYVGILSTPENAHDYTAHMTAALLRAKQGSRAVASKTLHTGRVRYHITILEVRPWLELQGPAAD